MIWVFPETHKMYMNSCIIHKAVVVKWANTGRAAHGQTPWDRLHQYPLKMSSDNFISMSLLLEEKKVMNKDLSMSNHDKRSS